jgi:acyl-coenzyme A thioesterase PaaI-like protein
LTTQAGPDWLTLTPPGGPEEMFRIGGTTQADGGVLLSMPTGEWLRGPDGRTASAALGVLIDDVLGNSIIERRPANSWPVSTEISVDYVSWPPSDGRPVQARSRALSAPPAGALAAGEVTDSVGAVLAVATSRFHFVPGEPVAPPWASGPRRLRRRTGPAGRTRPGRARFPARPSRRGPPRRRHGCDAHPSGGPAPGQPARFPARRHRPVRVAAGTASAPCRPGGACPRRPSGSRTCARSCSRAR